MYELKPEEQITLEDLEKYPIWAGYYEPDDFELALEYGLNRETLTLAFNEAGWEDGYFFPIPKEAIKEDFMRGKIITAKFVTPADTELKGYIFDLDSNPHQSVTVFHQNSRFHFSHPTKAIIELAKDIAKEIQWEAERNACNLSSALKEDSIFPLKVTNLVTNSEWEFELFKYQGT